MCFNIIRNTLYRLKPFSISSYNYFYSNIYPSGSGHWDSNFELVGASNPYVDAGYSYADTDNTQQGTSTNDCGAYGGPHAGRVGVGKKHSFTTSSYDIAGDIEDNTYKGDHIVLAAGSYTPGNIELKQYRYLYGAGAQQTIIHNNTNSPLITMEAYSHVEGVTITGSGKDGIRVDYAAYGARITKTLFRDFD